MTSKKRTWGKSSWGKSADWNAPKGGRKKSTTWGTPEQAASAASKKGGRVRKFLGPLW